MTNDAKLGMVAGVVGVIVAAVFLSNAPPSALSKSDGNSEPTAKEKLAATPQPRIEASTAPAPPAAVTPPQPSSAALASTPVPRTRKDVDAQPASRQLGMEEEP